MKRVVYFSKMFQAVPHLAQVERQLEGNFISNRVSTLKAVKKFYPEMPRLRYFNKFGFASAGCRAMRDADVIVTGSSYPDFLGVFTAKKCSVFHGTYMFFTAKEAMEFSSFDLLCVIGPRMEGMLRRHAVVADIATRKTGFLPFGEFPEKGDEQRQALLARLGLDATQKTVLYTPSNRKIGSWLRVAEALIRTTPADINVILRPHPRQALTPRAADRRHFAQLLQFASTKKNIFIDIAECALPELLAIADVIISDANSPSEESMFYGVPQLLIETPDFSRDTLVAWGKRDGMHDEDMAHLLTLYDCGENLWVDEPPDFSTVLYQVMENGHHYASQREHYFEWVFGERDRKAGERVAMAIKEQLL